MPGLFVTGQLTSGPPPAARSDSCLPKPVPKLEGIRVRLVAGGWRHMLAADESGTLWAWGW